MFEAQLQPVGAGRVPLVPGRSIAVDKLHVYGTPFFIDATLPVESAKPTTPFRRLMVAQDTGSAIVGPARADLYWGAGDDAARIAGRIRHPGRFVMLLPRELDMVEAGKRMPLPVPKPVIPEIEVKKEDAKVKATAGRAGTPASAQARSTANPSIASTAIACGSEPQAPSTAALVPIGSARASGSAARKAASSGSSG